MLRKLLEMSPTQTKADPSREETKLRAAMMLSKVFLQHLTPLSSLPTFPALWLTILDLIGQFCATASTDLLADALPESLKNMLLVMDTSGGGLFFTPSGNFKISINYQGMIMDRLVGIIGVVKEFSRKGTFSRSW